MRRQICRIGCCILLGLAVVVLMSCEGARLPVGEEAEKGEPLPTVSEQDTVTISGEVIVEGYEKGPIMVIAQSEEYEGPLGIASKEIPGPGKYVLEVPVNAGDIYLQAMNLRAGEKEPGLYTPGEGYKRNPVKVGSSNIGEVDIRIPKGSPFLMATYEGPTVTVLGTIVFKDYRNKPIVIGAWSERYAGPPDIAGVIIPKPGKYVLEVPVNAGEIYLVALNIRRGEMPRDDTPAGEYEGNPLKVGSSNIGGINITVSRK